MLPMRAFEGRFEEILEAMDEILDVCDGDDAETLEDLNAEAEDALLMLNGIDLKEADWREEAADVLKTLSGLCGDYRMLAERIPEIAVQVERLQMAVDMAMTNIGME